MLAKLFLHKGIRFYLEIAAGILGIISAIIFFAIDRSLLSGDIGFSDISHFTLIFMIVGSVVAIADAFLALPGLGILSAAILGCAIGDHLRLACYPLADLSVAVPFFTKDVLLAQAASTLFITFLVIFVLLAIIVIVSNFLSKKKA